VQRLLVVGGAGSLEVAPGVQLLDTPQFPAAYKPTAEGARQALALLRDEQDLDWSMLSPSAVIAPGTRTGRFRLGTDQLLADAQGDSRISVEDYALAFGDELERPAHSRRRFTVGY
jgi:putative NADH-flavin reductase